MKFHEDFAPVTAAVRGAMSGLCGVLCLMLTLYGLSGASFNEEARTGRVCD